MSTLSVPRLFFKGTATWNPATGNNNDQWPVNDVPHAELNWDYLKQFDITRDNVREKFPDWAISLRQFTPPSGQGKPYSLCPGEWDYYGGMEWSLHTDTEHTAVTGGQTSLNGAVDTHDPVIGAVLDVVGSPFPGSTFNTPARMVDNNPDAFWSTNFYLQRFQLGTRPAPGYYLSGDVAPGTYPNTRWLTFQRNLNQDGRMQIAGVGGVVMQACLPTKTLTLCHHGSALLKALEAGLEQPGVRGLMVRCSAYLTRYFNLPVFDGIDWTDPSDRLTQQYQRLVTLWGSELDTGLVPSANPAVSTVVGAIGLWHDDDPLTSVPGGRHLFAQRPYRVDSKNVWLGPVVAEAHVVPDSLPVLSLDLGNAIPETGSDGTKLNVGPLQVKLQHNGDTTVLGEISPEMYDKESYEATAGIVDLPLRNGITAEQLIQGRLLIDAPVSETASEQGRTGNAPTLAEREITVETDDRSVYVDQGGTGKVTIHVRERGQVPTRDITVQIQQYLPDPLPPATSEGWRLLAVDDSDMSAVEPTAQTITVKADSGRAEFSFTAKQPGNPILVFFAQGQAPDPLPETIEPFPGETIPPVSTANAAYTCVRVLPFDDDAPDAFWQAYENSNYDPEAAWKWLYGHVLYLHDVMYPVMRHLASLDLGDRTAVEKNIDQIVELCQPELLHSTVYMPVSRELSAGKRKVLELYRYLVHNNWPAHHPEDPR